MQAKRFTSLILTGTLVISVAAQAILGLTQIAFADDYGWSGTANSTATTEDAGDWTADDEKFTYKEWTGIQGYTDKTSATVNAADVVEINRIDQHTTASSVPYESIETAIIGARDYKKEASKYVQMLTGESQDWDLVVLENWADAQDYLNASQSVIDPSYTYTTETLTEQYGQWSTQTLPASWTSYGYDYTIYTNTVMPWQPSSSLVSYPYAPGYSDET